MSGFVVSARKYRPTTFDEVVGQDHIAQTLKNALLTDHVAQAFLFTGPRGVGKTTSARILAKIINCETPIGKVAACNQCPTCKAINDNASFNIFELDAASNNSVENIRSLVEQVRFRPQVGKYKVIILDEVHMLSTSAFNAFLKTLEEPPSHAIFILATTEKHKVIPTILSRCQIFDFKRITISDTVKQLQYIAKKEGIETDEEALHVIANKADGAMRDALSIFDKISSATNGQITYKDVVANLNLLDYEHYFNVTDALMRQDLANTFLILNEIIGSGFDPEHFLNGLADHFRDLLIAKNPATVEILDISDELKRKYLQQAALAPQHLLLSGISILAQCEIDLPLARNKRLHVELALSKLVYINHTLRGNELNMEGQEKKTPIASDSSVIITKPTEPQRQNLAEIAQEIKVNEEQKQVEDTTQYPSPTSESSIVEDSPSLPITANPAIKKLSFSKLDNIREAILQSEATLAANKKNLSLDKLTEIWTEYRSGVTSMSSQTTLNYVKLSLDDSTFGIVVPNQLAKETILLETKLLDKLRTDSGELELLFNIVVDKEQFPDYEDVKPIQTITQKDKYIIYLEKNPSLGTLTSSLGLKLDNETN